MTGVDQQSGVDWNGSVPVARRFEDPYFSLADGLAETRHVFFGGNDLPARFCDGFHVAELGFGTGLNLLATWDAWRKGGQSGTLHYTSFEAYPMSRDEMSRALKAFPELADLAEQLIEHWNGKGAHFMLGDDVHVSIVEGDARDTLPDMVKRADAWFLDGFSPAKNPELWGADLMQDVAHKTAPGGTFATYTAAGHVRRALASAGFEVSRIPGYGRKRHMSVGRLAQPL